MLYLYIRRRRHPERWQVQIQSVHCDSQAVHTPPPSSYDCTQSDSLPLQFPVHMQHTTVSHV